MSTIMIRNEKETDYSVVEEITRKAFYNIYVPGATEHYLVHIMRQHEDFIPELDFVIELDGRVIGNIMYTKARLIDEAGTEKEILTFGPVSIDPEYQRAGYGKLLLEHSFEQAARLGYDVIVIFGSPMNYVSRGFKSCKKYHVCIENGKYPAAMMVKELTPMHSTAGNGFTTTALLWPFLRKKRRSMMIRWKRWKRNSFPVRRNFIS